MDLAKTTLLTTFLLGVSACTGNYSSDIAGMTTSGLVCGVPVASTPSEMRAPASEKTSRLSSEKKILETKHVQEAKKDPVKKAPETKKAPEEKKTLEAKKVPEEKKPREAKKAVAVEKTSEVSQTSAKKEAPAEGKTIQDDQENRGATSFEIREPGMSLSILSSMIYGTSKRWQEIAEWNGIQEPYRIYLGQKLILKDPVKFSAKEMAERLVELKKVHLAKRNAKARAEKLAESVSRVKHSEVKRSLASEDATENPSSTDTSETPSDHSSPTPNDSTSGQDTSQSEPTNNPVSTTE